MSTIGIAGVGIMGSAMASHLIARDYRVIGYDVSAERLDELRRGGGVAAGSVAEVVDAADVLFTSLPTTEAAAAVLDGVSRLGRPGLTVVETSTLPLAMKASHREKLLAVGVTLLDCPLSGTGEQARSRDVVVYGSGDESAFEIVRPVLEAVSRSVRFLGQFGNGTVMKYVANLLVSIHNAATAEAFALGIRAGLDPELLYETIRDGAGNSVIFEKRGRLMADTRYVPATAKVSMFVKDTELIRGLAREVGMQTPVLDSTKALYEQAVALGFEDHDAAVLLEVIGSQHPADDTSEQRQVRK